MNRTTLWLRLSGSVTAATVLAAAAYLWAFRSGIVAARPAIMASLVAGAAGAAVVTFVLAIRSRAVATVLFCAGVVLVSAGGLANWMLSLQGMVILNELEAVPLNGGGHLQRIEAGALSRVGEMDLTLQLEKIELLPVDAGFVASSRLRILEPGLPPRIVTIAPGKSAALRSIRFHQGAFGFSPRIVITRNGETLFDRHVPFYTESREGRQLAYVGRFEVKEHDLQVNGALDLRSLDERMRGHEKIGLTLRCSGKPIGSGELDMGHFARLSDGYAIGFAGLRKWSEIDLSRRNYPAPIFAGIALWAAGAIAAAARKLR